MVLIELPDHATLYQALLARDPSYEGRAYVCVGTTGIFCRITCPARKPKSENCQFQDTIGACISAGFRPCKRCHPLGPAAESDPAIGLLLKALEQEPERRWSEQDVIAVGLDPSTVRRSFKRQFGMTFLEMARQKRLRDGFDSLAGGQKVITAQHEAGFSSASAFRRAFSSLVGCAPGALKDNALLRADWIQTPLGDMIAVSSKSHLHLLEFTTRKALPTELGKLRKDCKGDLGLGRHGPTDQIEKELQAYFEGESDVFETPVDVPGSAFTKSVWDELRRIPAGHTRSYGEIARRLGRPEATRAVARANGANQIAIAIPCHRVIGADGSLTGYGGGLWRKQRLIEIEMQFRQG